MSVCRPCLFRSSTRAIQLRAFHHLVIRVNENMRVAGFLRPQRAAITLGFAHHPISFALAVTSWGFFFWMAVPACFSVLAAHSKYPAERAGGAQAYMAGGRVIGPLIGGTMFAVSPQLLGLVGAAIMIMAAVTFIVLERRQGPLLAA